MPVSETEVDRLAREMIKQHGMRAAYAAVERVNDMIDRGDWRGRDAWASVVRAIHQLQRAAANPSGPGEGVPGSERRPENPAHQ